MTREQDNDGWRLPIKLDSTSNGEFAPIPLDETLLRARGHASARAGELARRLGRSRRSFMISACGAASSLLAFNAVHAAAGRTGGFFEVSAHAALDEQLAAAELGKREFIFDVQGHFVNPTGAWLQSVPAGSTPLKEMPKAGCSLASGAGRDYLRCLGGEEFIKDVFLDSDTDMMVLSFVPSTREGEPLTIEEAVATRDIVERMEGSHRLLLHGRVNPNQAGDLEDMDRLAKYGIVAWKTYTQWGPGGASGFWMTDEAGIAFVEKARQLGIRNICIHKGIPFGKRSYEHSTCRDVGPIAKRFPDVNFLIYHAGWVPGGVPEGPYDPKRTDGIDALVTSLLESGVPPNSNVYAELGSTWRFLSLRRPDEAAHALGKLFRHVGEDNVLWGTDSIWYGSPQDQIQAFRTFQIAEPLRAAHGYPQITGRLRQKVFAHNAARPYALKIEDLQHRMKRDAVEKRRQAYQENPDPSFRTHGPRTRREFLNLLRLNSGRRA